VSPSLFVPFAWAGKRVGVCLQCFPLCPFSCWDSKVNLSFDVCPPVVGCSSLGWISLLERAEGYEGLDISWSLKSLLVGLLRLETCVELSMQGFACLAGCERAWGGPNAANASSLDLPPFLTCESDGALMGGFDLLARVTP
jgi:hypothetical protein